MANTPSQDQHSAQPTNFASQTLKSSVFSEPVEDKYRTLFNSIEQGFHISELIDDPAGQFIDWRFLEVNAAFERQTGLQDVVGRLASEVAPGTESYWLNAYEQVVQTGQPMHLENYNQATNRWYAADVSRLGPAANRLFVVLFSDITQRKQEEASRRLLDQINDDLSRLTTEQALMQSVGQRLACHLKLDGFNFCEVDEAGGTTTVMYVWNTAEVHQQVGTYRIDDYMTEEFARSQRAGEVWVVNDSQTDPRVDAQATAAISLGAYLVFPYHRQGQWRGLFTATDRHARVWTPDEIRLIQEVTLRIFQRLERTRAEEALRQSEEKYRTLFNSIDEGFSVLELIFDEQGRVVDYWHRDDNPAFTRMTGIKDPVGKRMSELVADLEPAWYYRLEQVYRTGEPVRLEYPVQQLGQWYSCYLSRIDGEGSPFIAAIYDDITERKTAETALRASQEQQAYLLMLSDALRSIADSVGIEETATSIALQQFRADRCYYCRIENGQAIITRDALRGDLPSVAGTYPLSSFPLLKNVIEVGQPFIVEDAATTPILDEAIRAICLQLRVISFMNVPVVKQGRVVGVLCTVQSSPRCWTQAESQLAIETAERIWAAVERTKAEVDLRASQKRFESIANLVPDLIWDSQPDGATNWYNQRWLDYTGQRSEEAIGWGWTDAIHPDDRAASKRRYDEAVAAGTSLQQEHRIRRHDGVYRWFVVSTAPLKDPTGHVIKMYGAATDITDHKLAQEAIQKSEQQLAELRHLTLLGQTEALARMGSWEYHRQSGQFTWSAGMYQLTQVSPQRVLSPEIYRELAIEADRPQAYQLVDYLRAGQGHFENQLRIQVSDTVKTLRIKADVIGQGADTRVVGVYMDFTQQLLAQQRIRETAESLQAVLDSSPASIGLLKAQRDERGRLVDFRLAVGNDKLARFLDEPLANLLGQPAQRFGSLLWDGETLARLRHIFTTRQGHYEEKPLPAPHQDTWVALSVTQQDDGVVLTVLDITALKQIQTQQQHWLSELEASRHSVEALAQLKTALQHRSESLRAVSHDLKSNFGIITGSLSLLELAESEAEREQFVSMALRNVQQATGLLSELLDLTRLESSEQALRVSAQNVSTLFRELGENLTPLAHQQGLALRLSGPDRLEVDTDELLLYRLVQNLAMNALKYTHQGGVEVAWGREPGEDQWWFVVADTGSGLAAHLVERLNTPDPLQAATSEADPTRSIGSTEPSAKESWASLRGEGIGLRIVREITHLLGAQLQVSSAIGSGTRFVVQLPVRYLIS